jgi:hypothetical protein
MSLSAHRVLACALSIGGLFTTVARGADRTFVNLVVANGSGSVPFEPGDGFRYGGAINNAGVVAFRGERYVGRDEYLAGVYTVNVSAPHVVRTIYEPASADRNAVAPSISDDGTIVMHIPSENSVFTATAGGAVTPTYVPANGNSEADWLIYGTPAINNTGQIAFRINGRIQGEWHSGLASGNTAGTPVQPLARYPQYEGVSDYAINSGGRIAWGANGPDGYGVYAVNATGGTVGTVISSDAGDTFYDYVAINDNDRIAYVQTTLATETQEKSRAVRTTTITGETTLVADSGGAYDTFGVHFFSEYSLAINNNGSVAFYASLDDGYHGIFTGPDPVADKVIAVGDPLFGGIVNELSLDNEGINDDGTIAFGYQIYFPDAPAGTPELRGLAVAMTAVPEPAAVGLLGCFGLSLARRRRA